MARAEPERGTESYATECTITSPLGCHRGYPQQAAGVMTPVAQPMVQAYPQAAPMVKAYPSAPALPPASPDSPSEPVVEKKDE